MSANNANIERRDFDDPSPSTSASRNRASSNTLSVPAGVSILPVRGSGPLRRRATDLQPSVPTAVGGGMLDPFEAHPPTQAPDVDKLMNHYLSTFVYRSFPFYATGPMIQLWWPFVRTDNVLFHITLLLSALNLEKLEQQEEGRYSKKLLGECVTLLRSRLQDPDLGTSDHTIVAVANLATIEHERGNIRNLQLHMEGLKQMVNIRGGLNAIRSTSPIAANLVFWMSLVAINEVQLIPIDLGDISEHPQWPHSLSPHERLDFAELGIDKATTDVMLEVEDLSRHYTAFESYSSAEEAIVVISHFCSVLQRLLQIAPASGNRRLEFYISECCRYAAALHVFTPLSGFYPDPTLMINTLTHKLKASLAWILRPVEEARNELLLWLLSVGGISTVKMEERDMSGRMPEHQWFVGHLIVLVADLNIRSWDDFRQQLVKVTWYDNFCEVSLGRLWQEIALKKEALDSMDPDSV